MKIQTIKTNKLKLYPGNPRTISERMFEKLQQSIETFGIVQPLVVNPKMQVIGGNQRLLAIRALGIESVPVVVVDLPKGKEKALNIALNKITGQFDVEALKEFFADIDAEDIELTGFTMDEVEQLGTLDKLPDLEDYEGEQKEKEAKEITCPHCGYKFTLGGNK